MPRTIGGPRRHGGGFVVCDPDTWGEPHIPTRSDTRRYGPALACAWNRLHPRLTHCTAWITHLGNLPILEGTVIRLEVGRLHQSWSTCCGRRSCAGLTSNTPSACSSRPWLAFPKLRTSEAADRWGWLILVAYTQLRLARPRRVTDTDITVVIARGGQTLRWMSLDSPDGAGCLIDDFFHQQDSPRCHRRAQCQIKNRPALRPGRGPRRQTARRP